MEDPLPLPPIDFENTEVAFQHKSDKELIDTYRLFLFMSKPALVGVSSFFGEFAAKLNLRPINAIIRKTIFEQFCGGENLLDCQSTIDSLYNYDTLTILDYGLEAKTTEAELDSVMQEILRGVELAASNDSVPVVVVKCSALADNAMMEARQLGKTGPEIDRLQRKLWERMDRICKRGAELKVGVFIDAEESWIQDTIDDLAMDMMCKYNHKQVIVFNTFQLYRKDRLQFLKDSFDKTSAKGVMLGAKLVRGAYMDKERARAEDKGYASPIHDTKVAVDADYNAALLFCIERYDRISSCCATHNLESNYLQAKYIDEHKVPRSHPHLNFSQLYGMSDYISFNLAQGGFNVAKYVPYGPIKDVVPYLIRRAKENTSVSGEMGRELSYLLKEKARRGL